MEQCPYCKNEMKKGYLEGDGRQDLIWVEENQKRNITDKLFKRNCVVVEKAPHLVKIHVNSWYCNDCKKIIIDVQEDEEG